MDAKPWVEEIESFLVRADHCLEWKVVACKESEDGDRMTSYNASILEQLVEKGKLSKEIVHPLLKDLGDLEKTMTEFEKFLRENPYASEEEKCGQLEKINGNDPDKHRKKLASVRYLLSLQQLLNEEKETEKMLPLFRRSLRPGEDFGITKAVMDRLVYLPDLLDGAKLTHIDGDHYLIRSELSAHLIGLEYHFISPNRNVAEQIFESYREDMVKDALKVLLGFWGLANDKGMFHYTADISNIMTRTADLSRDSYFSVKEKKRFWALTKLLESTKLTLIIPYKIGKYKEKRMTVEHRLVEISARDSENTAIEDEYPTRVRVRVLNYEEFGEKAQIATAIANGTARLPVQDILLALSIQTRSSQRQKSGKVQFNEDYLVRKAHLKKTNESNPRVARQRLRIKFKKFADEKIVDNWSHNGDQYVFRRKYNENSTFHS